MEGWKRRLLSLCLALVLGVTFLPSPSRAAEKLPLDHPSDTEMEISPEENGPEKREESAAPEQPEAGDLTEPLEIEVPAENDAAERPEPTEIPPEEAEEGEDPIPLAAPVLTCAETAAVQDLGGNWYSVVQVSWEPVEGAERYQILRRTEAGDWEPVGYCAENSYTDYDVTRCTTYFYTVCCADRENTPCSPYDETGVTLYYPSGRCGDQVSWRLMGRTLEITGSGPMDDTYNMELTPWFALRQAITNVQVGEGITHLSSYAFQRCAALKTVSLPESLTSLGRYAFFDCTALQTVDLPQGVTGIPERAFYRCGNLSHVTLPDGLTSIGKGAFDGCGSLRDVTLPQGLTQLGASAFSGCKSLLQIDLPQGVTEMGLNTFSNCTGLREITLPAGFASLGDYALSGCTGLTHLELPDSLTYLGTGALCRCSALETVRFSGPYPGPAAQAFSPDCTARAYYPATDRSWTVSRRKTLGEGLIWIGWSPSTGEVQRCATPELTASNGAEGVHICWQPVEGAEQYRVFRRDTANNTWRILTDTAALSYVDTQVESGVTYRYTVRCLVDGVYASGYDLAGKTTCYLSMPETRAVNAAKGVTVTWSETAGAERYFLYRRQPGGRWSIQATVDAGARRSWLDTSAQGGSFYYYTVRAARGSAKSIYLHAVSIRRLAQPNVSAVNSADGVTISWNRIAGATGYRVFRKTSGQAWRCITTVKGNRSCQYLDKAVQGRSGSTYLYTVRAERDGVLSSYHGGKSLLRLAPPTVSAANSGTGITVSWSKVAGADCYRVYRKASGESWKLIATVKGNASVRYLDQAVRNQNGSNYLYVVRAAKGGTLSAYRSGRYIARLTQPSIAQLSSSGSRLTAAWDKNRKATGYQIQYAASANFSGAKTVKVNSGSTAKATVSGLSKGKTYYVRVRALRTWDGKTSYSAWSGGKRIKISR